MRVIFRVVLFPVSLILTIFVAFSSFLIEKCAIILNIISGLLFLLSILGFLQYFFGWPMGEAGRANDLQASIVVIVLAFILSPYGLPTVLTWIVDRLDDLNDAIKSI